MASVSSFYSKWSVIDDRPADLSFLSPKLKRRLTPSISMALEVAYQCVGDEQGNIRSVYCTRYGEYVRTYQMLNTLINDSMVSPASFSLSTHNVPSGIQAMNAGNTAASSTVSSLGATLENGFLEAAMMVHQYAEPILMIYVDIPLPELYGPQSVGREKAMALGVLLTPSGDNELSLSWRGRDAIIAPPIGLSSSARALTALLLSNEGYASHSDGRLDWSWRTKNVCPS
mgnify:FL=1